MHTILKNNDILSITIFKSRYEYQILRKKISNNEMLIGMFNYFNLIAVGVIPAIFSLINMMMYWPFFVQVAFKC